MSLGRSAVATDAGRRRRRNEDSYVCDPPLFAVADGMGGAQAGELASRIAATVLRDGVWLEDIGSTNGTFLNGTRVDRPHRLSPGDVVRVGETDLRYDR